MTEKISPDMFEYLGRHHQTSTYIFETDPGTKAADFSLASRLPPLMFLLSYFIKWKLDNIFLVYSPLQLQTTVLNLQDTKFIKLG